LKKALIILPVLILSIILGGCSSDSALTKENKDLKEKVTAYEAKIKQLENEVASLKGGSPSSESQNNTGAANQPAGDNAVKYGQKYTVPGFAEFTIKESSFTGKVNPPNTSGVYSYYKTDDQNKTYLLLTGEIKNLNSDSINVGAFNDTISAEVSFQGKYTYNNAVIAAPSSGDSDFYDETIQPLENKLLYIMCEVPAELKNDQANVKVTLKIRGQEYLINLAQ
jgi:outer membrane murein-binding lipoprotein Lpp